MFPALVIGVTGFGLATGRLWLRIFLSRHGNARISRLRPGAVRACLRAGPLTLFNFSWPLLSGC